MTLEERVNAVDLSGFTVDKITRGDDFVLIKAYKNSTAFSYALPVFFAFYDHYIVCSGNFGEWVFECTWETTKRQIPTSVPYLLEKLSVNNKKTMRAGIEEIGAEFERLRDNFYEAYNVREEYADRFDDLEELFDSFSDDCISSDEYRIASVVDQYQEDICDLLEIEVDWETWAGFYEVVTTHHDYLINNLAMLQKIRELNVLFEDKIS